MSFVDTNVFVHSTFQTSPEHSRANTALTRLLASSHVAISRQTLREYLSAVTRPQSWAEPMPLAQAVATADRYAEVFALLEDGPAVWNEFRRLSRSVPFGGKQVHDANIVATMLAHGERQLLTFNGAHFRRFGGLIALIEP